jgi:hypothetical protein
LEPLVPPGATRSHQEPQKPPGEEEKKKYPKKKKSQIKLPSSLISSSKASFKVKLSDMQSALQVAMVSSIS